MEVRRDRKAERSHSNCQGCVQRCRTRRVAKPKLLVSDMSRVHSGTDYPRRQPPEAHLIRRQREDNADDTVQNADDYRRTEPRLSPKCIHDVWPNARINRARTTPIRASLT